MKRLILLTILILAGTVNAASIIDDMMAYWSLNENDACRVYAEPIANKNGVLFTSSTSAISTTGKIGNGARIGASNPIHVGNAFSLVPDTGAFTLAFWAKRSVAHGIVGLDIGNWSYIDDDQQFYLWRTSIFNGEGEIAGYDSYGAPVDIFYGVFPDNGTWHLVVFTCDATDSHLYYDSTEVATGGGGSFTTRNDYSIIEITSSDASAIDENSPAYDEIAIWKRKLSQADVNTLYNSGSGINLSDYFTKTLTFSSGANGSITTPASSPIEYTAGTVVPLLAVPATGYHFEVWTGDTTYITDVCSADTTITMTADATIVATFAINTYTLTYTTDGGGTITGDTPQTVDYNQDGNTVTAVPDGAGVFLQWSDGNTNTVRTDRNVKADINVMAWFMPPTNLSRTLTVSTDSNGTVTTPGIGAYFYGDGNTAIIVAEPNAHYHFDHWSGTAVTANKVADANAYSTTVTMDANYTVMANFDINEFSLTTYAGTGGTVSPSGTNWYDYNTAVTIVATPRAGYHFTSWTVAQYKVSGTLSPDATGDYLAISWFYEMPYYARIGGAWWLYRTDLGTCFVVDAAYESGMPGHFWKKTGATLDGSYVPTLAATGTATVSILGTNIADTTSASTTIIMDANCAVVANFAKEKIEICAFSVEIKP
jgi:hypothetical protein